MNLRASTAVIPLLVYSITKVFSSEIDIYKCDESLTVESNGIPIGHQWGIHMSLNPTMSRSVTKIIIHQDMQGNYYFQCKELGGYWYDAKGTKLANRHVNVTCPTFSNNSELTMNVTLSKGRKEDVGIFHIGVLNSSTDGETQDICSFKLHLVEMTKTTDLKAEVDIWSKMTFHFNELASVHGFVLSIISLVLTCVLCKCKQGCSISKTRNYSKEADNEETIRASEMVDLVDLNVEIHSELSNSEEIKDENGMIASMQTQEVLSGKLFAKPVDTAGIETESIIDLYE